MTEFLLTLRGAASARFEAGGSESSDLKNMLSGRILQIVVLASPLQTAYPISNGH
jgi:hypothetical protein